MVFLLTEFTATDGQAKKKESSYFWLKDPKNLPDNIAFLRLDTDWYESTLTEILQLWPRLQVGGIMVLDDYHSWQGSKKAFNEVFGNSLKIHTIDRTAIYVMKERP